MKGIFTGRDEQTFSAERHESSNPVRPIDTTSVEMPSRNALSCDLVGKERQTKMMLSHMVPYKGAGIEWVIALLGRDLRKFGIADNPTVVLKSDQEPALVDLLKGVQSLESKR